MAIIPTCQCQDGDEVLKCYEWRCQGTKRRVRKPEHTKEHIKKDSNRYFVEKIEKLNEWMNERTNERMNEWMNDWLKSREWEDNRRALSQLLSQIQVLNIWESGVLDRYDPV